ncbi:MAG TPA: class II aldolase/adducin family protein [Gaiellaceae bacterium]|nr:class II aldolase/adducin family protein [Gaiellaceae bacterium]
MRHEELREELCETLRRMASGGLVLGAAGNASARAGSLVVISPSALWYDTLRPEDVCLVDEDGRLVEGPAPSVEAPMHLGVLAARPEVGAIVHTHSPYATALSRILDEIPAVEPEQPRPVPVARPVSSGTAELGEAVLAAAGEREAVVVRDHGPVCFGPDLSGALARAFAVEENARIYALARLLGGGDRSADDERGP